MEKNIKANIKLIAGKDFVQMEYEAVDEKQFVRVLCELLGKTNWDRTKSTEFLAVIRAESKKSWIERIN